MSFYLWIPLLILSTLLPITASQHSVALLPNHPYPPLKEQEVPKWFSSAWHTHSRQVRFPHPKIKTGLGVTLHEIGTKVPAHAQEHNVISANLKRLYILSLPLYICLPFYGLGPFPIYLQHLFLTQ